MGLSVFPAPSSGFNPTTVALQQTITSGNTVTIPAGVNQVYAILVAGGGYAVGPNSANHGHGGGGGGAAAYGWIPANTSMPVTIGGPESPTIFGGLAAVGRGGRGGTFGVSPNAGTSASFMGQPAGNAGSEGDLSPEAHSGLPGGMGGGGARAGNNSGTGAGSGGPGLAGGGGGGANVYGPGNGGFGTFSGGGAGGGIQGNSSPGGTGGSTSRFSGGAAGSFSGGGGAGYLAAGGAASGNSGGNGGSGGGGAGGGGANGGSGTPGSGCVLIYY